MENGEDKQIVALSQRLAQVTAERDQLKYQHGDHDQDWQTQCQRYEERIVELHSVIAELSRKLDHGKNDVIPEESEVEDDKSYVTDSCLEEEDEEEVHDEAFDENSLAFERDLDKVSSSTYDHQDVVKDEFMYKIELFDELQNEMAETKSANEKLQQILTDRDRELSVSSAAIKQLQMERESLKRQLEDLQSTLEYEEAKMDRNGSSSGRSSNERRSLRRKKSSRGGRPPMSPTSPEPESVRPRLNFRSITSSGKFDRTEQQKIGQNHSFFLAFYYALKMSKMIKTLRFLVVMLSKTSFVTRTQWSKSIFFKAF